MATRYIRSVPSLAAHIRNVPRERIYDSSSLACPAAELVQTYHPSKLDTLLDARPSISVLNREADTMAHVLRRLSDHLQRLSHAYAEWQDFDAGAYFDLYPKQTEVLIDIRGTGRMTRITFFGDLMIPRFQLAEHYFVETFAPSYRAAFPVGREPNRQSPAMQLFRDEVEPEMARRWQHLYLVAQRLLWTLKNELDYLVVTDGEEEMFNWRPSWHTPGCPELVSGLLPAWESLTTFTMAVQCAPASRELYEGV